MRELRTLFSFVSVLIQNVLTLLPLNPVGLFISTVVGRGIIVVGLAVLIDGAYVWITKVSELLPNWYMGWKINNVPLRARVGVLLVCFTASS